MKTYEQLTDLEKDTAHEKVLNTLLNDIIEHGLFFDFDQSLQDRIDAAWKEMDRLQTPWFIGERIMETCRKDLEDMANNMAHNYLYAEPGEIAIYGVVKD